MPDIRTVAAAIDRNRAALRVLADFAQDLRCPATTAVARLGYNGDGAIEADSQHVVVSAYRGEGFAVFEIRAKPADARDDRFAAVGMPTDLARQGQQPQRGV